MTQALAIVPGVEIMEADPEADASALLRLARWCHRTTPLASVDGLDGLWLDVTGCAHLWGGETALLQALLDRLDRDCLQARVAIADTPGAAHALARHSTAGCLTVIPAGGQGAAIAPLPVSALRLAPGLVTTLRRLGFERISHLSRIPRALLARRFGPLPGLRLDHAHGHVHETLRPLLPEHTLQRRLAFLEPLITAEALALAIAHAVGPLCDEMERSGLGARQIDLVFERIDNQVAAIQIGTARPSRDSAHLVRLLTERLDTVDPGLGVEAIHLVIPLAEHLQWEQGESGVPTQDVSRLVDRLSNRLGTDRLYRSARYDSEMPERSVCHEAAGAAIPTSQGTVWETVELGKPVPSIVAGSPNLVLVSCGDQPLGETMPRTDPPLHLRLIETAVAAETTIASDQSDEDCPRPMAWRRPWALRRMACGPIRSGSPWPGRLHAPARLLDPPRRVEAIAALPDCPPVAFTWRRKRHRICRADGPERIYGEWWWHDAEQHSVRDYFQVEDESGQRFWLFREGNGMDPATGDLSWYLHGLF